MEVVYCDICGLPRCAGCVMGRIEVEPHMPTLVCGNIAVHQRRVRLWQDWPIPRRYQAAILGGRSCSEDVMQRLECVRINLDGIHGSVIITGPYGVGKTHLAAAIARGAYNLGIPVIFASVAEIYDRLKRAIQGDGEDGEGDIVEDLKTVEVLVLDDVGKQRSTDYINSVLWSVMAARYESGRMTVITTNLRDEEMAQTDGWAAIVDRLSEDALVIKMAGSSRRDPSMVIEEPR